AASHAPGRTRRSPSGCRRARRSRSRMPGGRESHATSRDIQGLRAGARSSARRRAAVRSSGIPGAARGFRSSSTTSQVFSPRRAAPATSLSVVTTARLCVQRPISPALSAARTSKTKSFPSRPMNRAVAVTVAPGGVAAVWVTSRETPTEVSPSRRCGRRTREAASSMRATMRDVANTGGNASASSRLRALARSEGATVKGAEPGELTAGWLVTRRTIRRFLWHESEHPAHARIPQALGAGGNRRKGPPFEKHGLRRHAEKRADVLARKHHGCAASGRSPDPLEDAARHDFVEPLKRIVQQPDSRGTHRESRQRELLLEPTAQACRSRAAMPHQAREESAKLECAAAPTASSCGAKRADTEMLVDRHILEEPAPIGDETHPPCSADFRREVLHALAIEKDGAAAVREKALQSLEQRGFPGAVGAQDRQD